MGFFDEYATPVDQIPTGFGLALGAYPVILTDVKTHVKEEDGSKAIILEFTVDTVNDPEGRSGKDDIWVNKPVQGDEKAASNARFAKQHLMSIGIPVEELNKFHPVNDKEKVIGTAGVLSITAGKNGYNNKSFKMAPTASGVSTSGTVLPAEREEKPLDLEKW